MAKFKNIIKILLLLMVSVPCTISAQNWKSMGSNSVAKFYQDVDQLGGGQDNRKLVVKINYAKETKDGTRSALQEIFVNCIERTYSIGTVKRYSLSDLQGVEKIIAATGRKQSPAQGSLGDDYIKRACEPQPKTEQVAICPPPKQELQGSVEDAISASKNRPASCVRGNQTVSSNISAPLNGQTDGRYEIYRIEGTSQQTQRLLIQIFSDGQASVISNGGGRMGYIHQGNGVFQSGSDVIKVDEKSRIVNVNGINVLNVNIEKKNPPDQVNLAYGQKLNFPKPLDSAKDQTELKAACVSSAKMFVSQSAGTAFNTKGAMQWAACTSKAMVAAPNFNSHVSNWNKRLANERVDTYILGIYFERCSKAFPVLINMTNGQCL